MWQTVLGYQAQSLFLIVDKCLDEGIALLRMSAELARDIARLAENDSLLQLWESREKGRTERKRYKTIFQFCITDKTEAYVYRLYGLSSGYGVHGHLTTAMHSIPTPSTSGVPVVFLEVPDESVYEAIGVWLCSFFPLQDMCARGFRIAGGPHMLEVGAMYDRLRGSFDELVLKYHENLGDVKAAPSATEH